VFKGEDISSLIILSEQKTEDVATAPPKNVIKTLLIIRNSFVTLYCPVDIIVFVKKSTKQPEKFIFIEIY